MSEPTDPRTPGDALPELGDEALRRDLARARGAGPSAASRARIEAGLSDLLGPPGGGGPGGASAAMGKGWIAVAAGVALVIGGLALYAAGRSSGEAAAPTPAPAASPRLEVDPAMEESGPSEPAPTASPPASQPPTPPPEPAAPPPHAAEPPPSEVSLLEAARRALPSHPARARRALRRAAAAYPTGVFVQERKALMVEVLVAEGHLERASRAVDAFGAQHPQSAHLPRLRQLVERSGEP